MLISKKTNLKSLKFGNTDKPGGKALNDNEKEPGKFAQQPYIRTNIPTNGQKDGYKAEDDDVYGGPGILGTGGPDIIIRGGALSVTRSVKDVSRLTQMFADTTNGARGIQYTVKENILSRTSVKTEASTGLGYAGGFANQGVYTPLSTIGQAGANAFGGHLNHLGLDPTSPMSGVTGEGLFPGTGLQKYESIFKGKDYKNRLEQLKDTQQILLNKPSPISQPQGRGDGLFSNVKTRDSFLKKIKNSIKEGIEGLDGINYFPNENTILSYSGGPGSILGAGETSINTAQYTVGKKWDGNKVSIPYFLDSLTISSKSTIIDNFGEIDLSKVNPSDFRKDTESFEIIETNISSSRVLSLSPDYANSNKNIHGRVNLGDPGKSNTKNGVKNVWNYSADNLEALDKITSSEITTKNGGEEYNDLVQFRIAVIGNPNKTSKKDGKTVTESDSTQYMYFRAFIDSFSDSYTATWNPVNYVGRGDTLYNYGNFGRTINMGFTIAAQSKPELIPMYNKLNYLASTLAPDYSEGGFMMGNIIQLTVGNYVRRQHGFISSLTYDVPQESPWEIAIKSDWEEFGDRGDSTVKELPHVIKASFSFTPIHNFLPQKAQGNPNNPSQKFIKQ